MIALGRLGLVVLCVVGAVALLATVAGTGWVLVAGIRNGPDELCWLDWTDECEEANEERRTARAEKRCADRYEDAAAPWAQQPRRSLDGTLLADHDGDAMPDRRAFVSACLRDREQAGNR